MFFICSESSSGFTVKDAGHRSGDDSLHLGHRDVTTTSDVMIRLPPDYKPVLTRLIRGRALIE